MGHSQSGGVGRGSAESAASSGTPAPLLPTPTAHLSPLIGQRTLSLSHPPHPPSLPRPLWLVWLGICPEVSPGPRVSISAPPSPISLPSADPSPRPPQPSAFGSWLLCLPLLPFPLLFSHARSLHFLLRFSVVTLPHLQPCFYLPLCLPSSSSPCSFPAPALPTALSTYTGVLWATSVISPYCFQSV